MSNVLKICLLAVIVAVSGCAPAGDPVGATPPPGFGFQTSNTVQLDLTLTLVSAPLGFASVQVTSVLSAPDGDEGTEDQVDGETFFKGFTDPMGRLTAEFSVPAEYEMLDLVIHRTGTNGPYTDEGLRTFWGPLAPSSRVTVMRADLASQSIDLQNN